MSYFRKLFTSRAWEKLVPDNSATVLTGGRGALGADYAAAARTSDGASVIVYAPSQRALTVDMSKVSGTSARAWWFNPVDGGRHADRRLPDLGGTQLHARRRR